VVGLGHIYQVRFGSEADLSSNARFWRKADLQSADDLAEGTIGDGWLAKRILRTAILFPRDHDKGVLTIGTVAFAAARRAFICQTHAR
jgi:hypothetical protein